MDEDQPQPGETPKLSDESQLENFVAQLTESQSRLKAYLLAALGNYDDALEVLQSTNLVLWRNVNKFAPGTDFLSWAITLARYEVLSFYRDRNRDRHVFSEELAIMMLQIADDKRPDVSERQVALQSCLDKLPKSSRELITLRYEKQTAIKQMATSLQRTEDSIKSALVRIRRSLAECITKRLGADSANQA